MLEDYSKVKAKVVEHHKNILNPERCVVSLYKKYVSKCPNHVIGGSVFYLTPKRKWSASDEIWFSRSPIGKKYLRSAVSDMCKKANLRRVLY